MKTVAAFSVCALVLLIGESAAAQTNGIRKAPELAFTVPGQGQKLLSQYRGKVVALEFVLTTCSHCQAASQLMTKFQQEYGPRGFQALDVAINGLDEGRTPAQADTLVQEFTDRFHVGFPVGWTHREEFMAFMGFSFVERVVVPQLVMIDRKGMIHYQTSAHGEDSSLLESTIRQRIEELLAQGISASAHHPARQHAASAKKGS